MLGGSLRIDFAYISIFMLFVPMYFMYNMFMLSFYTLCFNATCEWPEFYVKKDLFCSDNFTGALLQVSE